VKNSLKMKEERNQKVAVLENLLNAVAAEERDFTADEEKQQDTLHAEIRNMDAAIKRAEENEAIFAATAGNAPSNSEAKDVAKTMKRFSLSKAINEAAATGRVTGVEGEVFTEAVNEARMSGVALSGNVAIPQSFMEKRDYNVGTNADGGFTVQTSVGDIVEFLRPNTVAEAAGATILTGLSGNLDLPRHSTSVTPDYKAETGALDEVTGAMEAIQLRPRRVGAFSIYSQQLLAQSSAAIDQFIANDLAASIATEIDKMAFNGSGSSNEPTGILNVSGIGDVAGGTNGAVPSFANIVELESDVAGANALRGSLAYVTTPGIVGALKTATVDSGSGRFVIEGMMANGYNVLQTTNIPSALTKGTSSDCHAVIFGNFEDLILAYWSGVSLTVDNFTNAVNGQIRVIAQQWMDVGVRHAGSFAAMKDAKTA